MRDAGGQAERGAGQQARARAAVFVHGQGIRAEVAEGRLGFLVFVGQRDPGLDAVHRAALGARLLEALGVRDAAAGDHPVDLVGLDGLLHADAVAMHDLAGEQIGDRGEPDVRVRAHVDGLRDTRREGHRADVVEEDERADHVPARERQHAPDFEAAEVAAALVDDIHARHAYMGTRRPFPSEMGS